MAGTIENFIGSLVGGLAQAAGSIAGKVMLALGFGLAVFSGYDATMAWVLNQAVSNLQALPPEVAQVLSACKIDSAISMIGSAFSTRALLNGLAPGGALTRWVMRG